jgi:hypothetical protein
VTDEQIESDRQAVSLESLTDVNPQQFGIGVVIEVVKTVWFLALAGGMLYWLNTQLPTLELDLLAGVTSQLGMLAIVATILTIPLKVSLLGREELNRFTGVGWAINTTLVVGAIAALFVFVAHLVSVVSEAKFTMAAGTAAIAVAILFVILGLAWVFDIRPLFQPPVIGLALGAAIGLPVGIVLGLGAPVGAGLGALLGPLLYMAVVHLDARRVDRGAAGGALLAGTILALLAGDPDVTVVGVALGGGVCAGLTFERNYEPPAKQRRLLRSIFGWSATGSTVTREGEPDEAVADEMETEPEVAETPVRGYARPFEEVADEIETTEKNILTFPIRYPLRRSLWQPVGGGALMFLSFLALVLPSTFVSGFMLRISGAAMNGFEEPPKLRLRDLPSLILQGLVFTIAVLVQIGLFTVGLIVIYAIVGINDVFWLLGVLPVVLPAVYLATVVGDRLWSTLDVRLVAEILRSRTYWIHLVAAIVLTIPLTILVIVSLMGLITVLVGLFYALTVYAALWGRAAAIYTAECAETVE